MKRSNVALLSGAFMCAVLLTACAAPSSGYRRPSETQVALEIPCLNTLKGAGAEGQTHPTLPLGIQRLLKNEQEYMVLDGGDPEKLAPDNNLQADFYKPQAKNEFPVKSYWVSQTAQWELLISGFRRFSRGPRLPTTRRKARSNGSPVFLFHSSRLSSGRGSDEVRYEFSHLFYQQCHV